MHLTSAECSEKSRSLTTPSWGGTKTCYSQTQRLLLSFSLEKQLTTEPRSAGRFSQRDEKSLWPLLLRVSVVQQSNLNHSPAARSVPARTFSRSSTLRQRAACPSPQATGGGSVFRH